MPKPNLRSAEEQVARITGRASNTVALWREVSGVLAEAVPHFMAPCWFTMDPASLLVTSHFQEGLPEIPAEWLAQEYLEDDYNKMADVARSPAAMATLDDATGGRPELSARYREQMAPWGASQELLVALRTGGDAWGMLGLYREEGAEVFSAEERRFLAGVAPLLGAGARNSLLIGEATDPDHDDAPGLLLLTSALKRNTATAQAERWMGELEPPRESGRLPAAIISVGAAAAGGDGSPSVRVRTRAGRWLVVHGARLGRDQVGVVIEPVAPAKIAPLLMTAYGLTPREQEVTALVLRGFSTEEIAGELVVSEHTVQQHLKSIFEKTGVNSRRDLTGKVFFSHYEPRLRDNERRALEGKPLRGSPIALDRRT